LTKYISPDIFTNIFKEEPKMALEDNGIINKGIVIKGQLGGDIGLVIEGRVEGTIDMDQNITIGGSGEVVATVRVNNLTVDGMLEGNVEATEVIHLRNGCTVNGQLRAPHVVIEKDAQFSGELDMNVKLPEGIL
jgi:cytoskeletal protein CcmA (bactofilin family)